MSAYRTGPGLTKWFQDFEKDLDRTVQNSAMAAESVAKQNAPVDTGNLRNSIHYQNEGQGQASVSTNVEYAPAQEYGTRNGVPGRHYMQKGADAAREYIRKEAGNG